MYFPYEMGSGKDGKETPTEYTTRRDRIIMAARVEKYLYYLLQRKLKQHTHTKPFHTHFNQNRLSFCQKFNSTSHFIHFS